MGRTRIRLFLAALVLVPALLYWGAGHTPSERVSSRAPAVGVQSFARNAAVTQYTASGEIQETLRVESIEHRQQTQYLTLPALVSYAADGSTITVNAKRGTVQDDNSRLDLSGDVVIRKQLDGISQTLSAPEMSWLPDQMLAQTATAVVYRTPGHRVDGVGMKADLKTNRVELLSKVKGLHNDEK